jgi:hypothetical protein
LVKALKEGNRKGCADHDGDAHVERTSSQRSGCG